MKGKKLGRDNQTTSSTNRVNSSAWKQKLAGRDNWKDEIKFNHDSNDSNTGKDRTVDCNVLTENLAMDYSLEKDEQVGAFAVPGIEGGISDVEEPSLPNGNLTTSDAAYNPTSGTIISAIVVDNVVVRAIRMGDSSTRVVDEDVPSNVNDVPNKGSILKYRLISIFSLLLLARR